MTSKLGRPLPGDRVHFVGIGGVGMAALAELLLTFGYEVSGSDLKASRTVQRLQERGVVVRVGPHASGTAAGSQHVIVSNAVPEDNLEVEAARVAGTEIVSRAQLLGRIFDTGRGIAVTGTHGKTTTASMLARALEAAGADPSYLIGGDINDVGSGARLGSSDLVVAEADEAFGSFLHLHPEMALVTNVDTDHLDFYDGQAAIDDAFVTFLSQRKGTGAAVLCIDDPGIQRILPRVDAPIHTYGSADADLVLGPDAAVTWSGRKIGTLQAGVPGRHNLMNAAGALAAGLLLDADSAALLEGLRTFGGVERRFSIRGEAAGVVVIDDYAHNPRKVQAALDAAKETYPARRIVALFQPHLYSRTLHLGDAFGDSFASADVVVVTDIYAAREQPIPGVSGRIVSDAIRERKGTDDLVLYAPRLEEAAPIVAGLADTGDVVMTLGAGDVTTAATRILELLAEREDD